MQAIYRKELKLRFFSLSTYVLLFLTLLSFGILCSLFNLSMGYASLSYSLGYMTLIFAILLPFFVFFSSKKKGREGRERFLLSLPLSPTAIVLGDFFATLTLLLIPTLLIALLPFVFSLFGESPVAASETALLGCFLYCTFLLSGIRLLFSVIKRPTVALISSLVFTLFVYFLNSFFFYLPIPSSGLGEKLASLLNPTGIYYAFTYGKFNLPGVIYFVTLTVLFLVLQIFILKKKRGDLYHPKRRIVAVSVSALLLLTVLLSNVLSLLLPEKIANADVTGNDIFRISGTSLDVLHDLDEPISLYFLCEGGKAKADKELLSFLKEYAEESDKITLEVIDTDRDPDFSKAYTTEALRDQSILVVSEKRARTINSSELYHYVNAELGELSSTYYDYLVSTYVQYMQTGSMAELDETSVQLGYHLYYSNSTVAYFNGDKLLSNAILYVSSDEVRTVYIADCKPFSASKEDTTLVSVLSKNNFLVSYTDTLESIPADCDVLILSAPAQDIGEAERQVLEAYLARGGDIFLTTDYTSTKLPVLLSLLSSYGLSAPLGEMIVCETDEARIISEDTPYYFSATVHDSSYAETFDGIFLSLLTHPILIEETDGAEVTPLLSTTAKGALMDPVEEELAKEGEAYVIGALAQKKDASVFWLSSPLCVSSTANNLSSGGNLLYILSVLDRMCPQKNTELSIPSVQMSASSLSLSSGDLALWTLIVSVLIPLIPLATGMMYTYIRKKR